MPRGASRRGLCRLVFRKGNEVMVGNYDGEGSRAVALRKIDEALLSHGDVLEAAAFGVDSTGYGQTGLGLRAVAAGGERGGAWRSLLCWGIVGRFWVRLNLLIGSFFWRTCLRNHRRRFSIRGCASWWRENRNNKKRGRRRENSLPTHRQVRLKSGNAKSHSSLRYNCRYSRI